jgi:hypothetical protein
MTPEEVEKLQPNDRLSRIRPIDPLLQGRHLYNGEVIRRTEHGVIIRSDDPEDPPDGDLYGFDDPRLAEAVRVGMWQPGEPPWLESDRKRSTTSKPKRPKKRKRPKSRRSGRR